jgi:hypothetical protein
MTLDDDLLVGDWGTDREMCGFFNLYTIPPWPLSLLPVSICTIWYVLIFTNVSIRVFNETKAEKP